MKGSTKKVRFAKAVETPRMRNPEKLWLDGDQSYLTIEDGRFFVTHDVEGLGRYCGPEVLLRTTLLRYGEKTEDGMLVKPAMPWFQVLKQIASDGDFLLNFSHAPRKFEEFVAGAYQQAGFDDVILTPQSADRGRDVIAMKNGACSIRILDQAKAYSLGNLVTHTDVRAMVGVLTLDSNTSKGIITTTSDFQPTIVSGNEFSRLMPYRLELRNGTSAQALVDSGLRERRTHVARRGREMHQSFRRTIGVG